MNIIQFIKENQFKLILEIGAHFGTETLQFKNVVPSAEIYSFEPDPRNLKILHENGIDKICKLYPYALSNTNGTIDFYLSAGEYNGKLEYLKNKPWSASSSIKKPKEHLNVHKWVKFNEVVKVETIRLDDCKELHNKTIDFIWADVQGAEDLVFSGAKETLKRTRYVYTEFNNNELYEGQLNLSGIKELFGNDWEVVEVFRDDVLLKNKTL